MFKHGGVYRDDQGASPKKTGPLAAPQQTGTTPATPQTGIVAQMQKMTQDIEKKLQETFDNEKKEQSRRLKLELDKRDQKVEERKLLKEKLKLERTREEKLRSALEENKKYKEMIEAASLRINHAPGKIQTKPTGGEENKKMLDTLAAFLNQRVTSD